MIIETKYEIGDIVYLRTDSEQEERMVTAIWVNANGVKYELSCGLNYSVHFAMEMDKEKVVV